MFPFSSSTLRRKPTKFGHMSLAIAYTCGLSGVWLVVTKTANDTDLSKVNSLATFYYIKFFAN